jgi:hypothetical protein
MAYGTGCTLFCIVFSSTLRVAEWENLCFTPNRFASLGVIHIQSFGLDGNTSFFSVPKIFHENFDAVAL